jgi:ABC-type phosphate transport system permease subunit
MASAPVIALASERVTGETGPLVLVVFLAQDVRWPQSHEQKISCVGCLSRFRGERVRHWRGTCG